MPLLFIVDSALKDTRKTFFVHILLEESVVHVFWFLKDFIYTTLVEIRIEDDRVK